LRVYLVFLVGGEDIFRSGRWLILVDFLVGREWRFYMSKFKHLLGGEQRVKIRDPETVFFGLSDPETVFFGLMVRLYKLGVIGWVDIEAAADRFEEVKARLVPRSWRY
jgi:hypothetical protein